MLDDYPHEEPPPEVVAYFSAIDAIGELINELHEVDTQGPERCLKLAGVVQASLYDEDVCRALNVSRPI